jgi:hypothetical protein
LRAFADFTARLGVDTVKWIQQLVIAVDPPRFTTLVD